MPRNGSGTYSLPAGNPVVPGTVITSSWSNTTMTDIGAAITQSMSSDGQTIPTANQSLGNFRHTNVSNALQRNEYAAYGQVQDGQPQWMTVTGTDTIVATIAPGPTTYTAGQTFRFIAAGANTTTSVTLNLNGLGAKAVTKTGTVPLLVGDIPSGAIVEITYDGTQFQVVSVITTSASSASGASPFGIRNKLINSRGLINQRGYTSGAATVGANQYTLDQWRVVTSGQSLGYSSSGTFLTMTAPAGGVEQPIIADEIEGGTYFLTWIGTATATVNGTPVANGASISVSANTQATVRFINGTYAKPQFELGGVTPYQFVDRDLELIRAYRFAFGEISSGALAGVCTSAGATVACKFPVPMRVNPVYTALGNGTILDGVGALSITGSSGTSGSTFSGRIDVSAAGSTGGRGAIVVGISYIWSAEI